jgi:two-component system KDP operon response regulator KdpE
MGEPSVLIIEDDPAAAEVVATALRGRGHPVLIAPDGRAGLRQASDAEPDLIILDLGLPDIDGIDVCRELRRWFHRPILVLSADGDEYRKVAALDDGADDYVTKPYSMPELLARLRVAHRHAQLMGDDSRAFTLGALTIDAATHVAQLGGNELRLARREFALLHLLVRNAGRVVTHGAILDEIWNTNDLRRTDTLRVHITQLRRKLGALDGAPQIIAEPGVGYRIVES